jgi:hypothetical protein
VTHSGENYPHQASAPKYFYRGSAEAACSGMPELRPDISIPEKNAPDPVKKTSTGTSIFYFSAARRAASAMRVEEIVFFHLS